MTSISENRTMSGGAITEERDAKLLIYALEKFIAPLTHDSGDKSLTGSGLTSEAINLLLALQKFVSSITLKSVPPERRAVPDTPQSKPSNLSITDKPPSEAIVSLPNRASLDVVQRPPLLKVILEKARLRVFNKMPIRMLAFDSYGMEIRLVERPEVLRIVSKKIEKAFAPWEIAHRYDLNEEDDSYNYNYSVDTFINQHCAYAILSHTWLRESPGEVTFTDWRTKTFDPQLNGYQKLANFCRVSALDHGMSLGWMDTCCIDKSSSAELDESIRSMFRWYETSAVCVIYLADTMTLADMHKDTWFTRGWTLQELIAPNMAKFYHKDWKCLFFNSVKMNDKYDSAVLEEICKATSITALELSRSAELTSISRRMQWAAERNVTKEEDIAYSLMGIFNVSFSTAYGEGAEAAFVRLVREILNSDQNHSQTLDIVNWGHGKDMEWRSSHASMLLPVCPKYYAHGASNIVWRNPYEPIICTPFGLRVSILIMPALLSKLAQANKCIPRGDYYAIANTLGHFHASRSFHTTLRADNSTEELGVYNVLDKALFDANGELAFSRPADSREDSEIQLFGVLNFAETDTTVNIPAHDVCFAVVLYSPADVITTYEGKMYWCASMAKPVTFQLQHWGVKSDSHRILKTDLHRHGITLTTVYL